MARLAAMAESKSNRAERVLRIAELSAQKLNAEDEYAVHAGIFTADGLCVCIYIFLIIMLFCITTS